MSERKGERAAWTEYFEGRGQSAPTSKYGNKREGIYASKREAAEASKLATLERYGKIKELKEQVKFKLVEGDGKIRPIFYIADFTWIDGEGKLCIADAKGYNKDKVYRLKKKLMKLMLGLDIQEL